MGDFSAAGFTASGRVRGLDRAENFNGKYTTVGAGSAVTMRNEHGVTIDLVIATAGLKVSLVGPASRWGFPRASSRQGVRSGLSNVRERRIRDCHGYAV